MLDTKNLFSRKNLPELVLAAVSVLYILGDISPPPGMAGIITTPLGMIVLIASAIMLCSCAHPIITVTYLIAAYELYERSNKTKARADKILFQRDKRQPEINPEIQFPITLEEKVVKKMAPWVMKENQTPPTYKPVLDDDMNASEV